jgi:hypothetical protein
MSEANDQQLREILLDRGLEDWIPLPEIAGSAEVREVVGDGDTIAALSAALDFLIRDGRLRLYRGHRDIDPERVPDATALELLKQPQWYSFHVDDDQEERLYFVNVANIQDA